MSEGAIRFPRSARARSTYGELRRMGYGPAYACSVAEALEQSRNEFELWASAIRYVTPDSESASAWLARRGYKGT